MPAGPVYGHVPLRVTGTVPCAAGSLASRNVIVALPAADGFARVSVSVVPTTDVVTLGLLELAV